MNFSGKGQPQAPNRANQIKKLSIENAFDSDQQDQDDMYDDQNSMNDKGSESDQSPVLLKGPPPPKSR